MMGKLNDIVQMNVGQIFQTPPVPTADFTGKTVLITGANTGLGFESARHIYSNNASSLILACRNIAKGNSARDKLIASRTSASDCVIEVWPLDMTSFASVLAFGDRMAGLSRLDAVIANAGIDVTHWEVYEGFESTLTVNVISTLLLAFLALPKLRETAKLQNQPSYLTFTGSVMHIFGKDQYLSQRPVGDIFKSLNNQSLADMNDRYNLSKLLLLFGVRSLARQFDNKESVVINYVNPGWCRTDLFRTNDGGLGGRIGLHLIGKTAEEGSRSIVHGIVADGMTHGKYLSECQVKAESTFVRSDEGRAVENRVWFELCQILEDIKPGVTAAAVDSLTSQVGAS